MLVGAGALAAQTEVQAVAEGIGLGAFNYVTQKSRTASEADAPLSAATVVVPKNLGKTAKDAVIRAAQVARAVRLTRTLVDLSPDTATPEFVAAVATTAAKGTKVTVEVLAEKELTRGGYGGRRAGSGGRVAGGVGACRASFGSGARLYHRFDRRHRR